MKRLMTAALAFALSFCSAELYATENPIIHFAFTSSADDSSQYTGTPAGGAALRALGDRQVLDLGFNDDGTIVRVKPTHKGIEPVDVSAYMDAWMSGVEDVAVPFDSDADVVSTLYYDFMGRQLGSARPEAPGIYIRCDRLSSGSTRAAKIRL